jgi:hypothetical protein
MNSIGICDNDKFIWRKLLDYRFVNNDWNLNDKQYAIQIYKNNYQYVQDNHLIINKKIQNKCYMIACTYSNVLTV